MNIPVPQSQIPLSQIPIDNILCKLYHLTTKPNDTDEDVTIIGKVAGLCRAMVQAWSQSRN